MQSFIAGVRDVKVQATDLGAKAWMQWLRGNVGKRMSIIERHNCGRSKKIC